MIKHYRFISLSVSFALFSFLFFSVAVVPFALDSTIEAPYVNTVLPTVAADDIARFSENLYNSINAYHNNNEDIIIDNIYSPRELSNTTVIPVSSNVILEIHDIIRIKLNNDRSSRPFSLQRSTSYIVKDALIPVESLRFNLTCDYEYNHATDIICTDVSPSYSSSLLGILYNLSYSDVDKGKTGMMAWGKASFSAKIQIAGDFGVTLHNIASTGKIKVTPTQYDTGGWYFSISNDWT